MCDAVDKLQFLSFICNVTDNIFPLTGLFSETPVPLLSPKVEVLELPLVLLTLATYSTASHCFHIHVRALHNTNRKSWLANDSSDAVVHGCTCPCAMCQFTSPDADAMELYWAVWIGYKLRHKWSSSQSCLFADISDVVLVETRGRCTKVMSDEDLSGKRVYNSPLPSILTAAAGAVRGEARSPPVRDLPPLPHNWNF